jgi:hypothetical protein
LPRRAIASDTSLADRLLPREADGASTILVGHAHYDHLLDVPYVARARARRATIYGSPTMRHILMGDSVLRDSSRRVVALRGDSVGTSLRRGRWIYDRDSSFRFMAFEADHAPTLFAGGWVFASGVLREDLDSLPPYAQDWVAGEPLTYLVDVLDRRTGATRLRIYYQDTANRPPLGFPSPDVLAERPVDVALLTVAAAQHVEHTPDSLLGVLKPRYVIAGHWEDFFRPQTLPAKLNVVTDADAFLASLTRSLPPRSGWQMPLPRRTIRFDLR